MGKSKIFDVMSFLQSYSQSLSRKPIVNSEFYDVLKFTLVTRVCALLQHLAGYPHTLSVHIDAAAKRIVGFPRPYIWSLDCYRDWGRFTMTSYMIYKLKLLWTLHTTLSATCQLNDCTKDTRSNIYTLHNFINDMH